MTEKFARALNRPIKQEKRKINEVPRTGFPRYTLKILCLCQRFGCLLLFHSLSSFGKRFMLTPALGCHVLYPNDETQILALS